ncbi:MAG: YdaU family protein [Betaproteobacteria bacterium]
MHYLTEAIINYYERHLGDYAKDTAHLSLLEHGVYTILLDRVYSTESGIPDGQKYRLARARTEDERQAVDVVLDEFFHLSEGVWFNQRAEDEISKASARITAAQENGKRGGRPSKKPNVSENETQQKPSGLSPGSENETQQKAYQAPSTKHQTPVNPEAAALTQPESRETPPNAAAFGADPITLRAIEITVLLTKRGVAMQASDPRVRGWAERGVTDTQALQALDTANERRQERADPRPINAGLIDAILSDITGSASRKREPRRITVGDERAYTAAALTGKIPASMTIEQFVGQKALPTINPSNLIEGEAKHVAG